MKRYVRGFVAMIATVALMGGVAQAQETPPCDGALVISNTGAGSVNKIECVDATEVTVTCKNNIYVVTDSSQAAHSGNATNSGNTTGGSAITGNATNENDTTVQIGAACGAQPAAVTPEAPTPTTPQQVGGMGAGAGAGVAAPAPRQAATAVTTLPNTNSNPAIDNALVAGTGLTGLLIASQLGIAAYRRFALR